MDQTIVIIPNHLSAVPLNSEQYGSYAHVTPVATGVQSTDHSTPCGTSEVTAALPPLSPKPFVHGPTNPGTEQRPPNKPPTNPRPKRYFTDAGLERNWDIIYYGPNNPGSDQKPRPAKPVPPPKPTKHACASPGPSHANPITAIEILLLLSETQTDRFIRLVEWFVKSHATRLAPNSPDSSLEFSAAFRNKDIGASGSLSRLNGEGRPLHLPIQTSPSIVLSA